MAEHVEKTGSERAQNPAPEHAAPSGSGPSPSEAPPQAPPPTYSLPAYSIPDDDVEKRSGPKFDWRDAKDRIVNLVAGVARWIGLLFALVLVMHVIFVVGDANPENDIVTFARAWSETLSVGFKDLFAPADPKLNVLVNYGIAALFWLVVSAIVAKIIRRVGGAG